MGVSVWFCVATRLRQRRFQFCSHGNCNQYALSLLVVCSVLFVQLCWRKTENQVMFSGGGPCLSPSSSVTPVWLFSRESFQLPACLLLRAGKQIFPPDQSCLFLTWHVCLPSSVAVLPEGLPAASLSVRPVGGSGCTRSQGLLLFWHHGFF